MMVQFKLKLLPAAVFWAIAFQQSPENVLRPIPTLNPDPEPTSLYKPDFGVA